jgi:hypothetical protein
MEPDLPIIVANLYELSGKNIHITYSTSGIDGKPHFSYQDLQQTLSFSGDEIRSAETEIGTLISVTIHMTVDTGGNHFQRPATPREYTGRTVGTHPGLRCHDSPQVLNRADHRAARFLHGDAPERHRRSGVLLGLQES